MNTNRSSEESAFDELLSKALAGDLSDAEKAEFQAALAADAAKAREYEALRATVRLAGAPPDIRRDEEFWSEFTRSTEIKLDEALHKREEHNAKSARFLFFEPIWARALQMAALLLVGFWLGRGSAAFGDPEPDGSNAPVVARASVVPTPPAERELREFLQQSHLLLLGVMNLNSECGARDPNALGTQQQQSIALLVRAQRIKSGLSAEQAPTAQLIAEIEYALMQLADIKPASLDAHHIERIRSCSGTALCNLNQTLQNQVAQ